MFFMLAHNLFGFPHLYVKHLTPARCERGDSDRHPLQQDDRKQRKRPTEDFQVTDPARQFLQSFQTGQVLWFKSLLFLSSL